MPRRKSNGNHKREQNQLLASVRSAVAVGSASGALAQAMRRWSALWGVPGLPETVTFHFNGRLRATVARWVINARRLELSSRFFQSGVHHQAILCHELAHAAALLKYGRRIHAHGREWADLVLAAGFEPSAFHSGARRRGSTSATSQRSAVRYEHRCPVCHAVRFGRKPINAWRCMECVGVGLAGDLRISRSAIPEFHQ